MTNLLIKWLIKDYQNIEDATVRGRYGMFAGIVGMVTNLLLASGKIVTGMVAGSIAILADGVNNLTDAASSIVTLVGFKLARKPGDEEHPFGHARYEYVAGLIISIVVIVCGIQLIQTSVEKIIYPEPPEYSMVAVGVLLAAILAKLWQCLFYRCIGERIKSTTVKAASVDSRNDMIATTAVLISLLVGKWTGWLLADGVMGALVGALILYSGISLVKETISPLLGMAPDKEMVEELKKRLLAYDGILGMHDLVVHEYGRGQLFATVHLEVSSQEEMMKSHDLIDNIEREISHSMNMNLVIHMDPIDITDEKTLQLKEQVKGITQEIDDDLSIHDFRVVKGYTHTNLIFDVVLPTGSVLKEDELKRLLTEQIRNMSMQETYFAVVTVDRNYI